MFWTPEMAPLVEELSFEQLLLLTFEPKMQLTAFETELGCRIFLISESQEDQRPLIFEPLIQLIVFEMVLDF